MKDDAEQLELSHGQVLWVLARGAAPSEELRETVKYLRRLGIPFSRKNLGVGKGAAVAYRFEHLMELSVAMLLRARGMELADIAKALKHLRPRLNPAYAQACQPQKTGLGAPMYFKWEGMRDDDRPILIDGLYFDIGLYMRDGKWLSTRTDILGAVDVIRRIKSMGGDRSYMGLIALSKLAQDAITLARQSPIVRRGRP